MFHTAYSTLERDLADSTAMLLQHLNVAACWQKGGMRGWRKSTATAADDTTQPSHRANLANLRHNYVLSRYVRMLYRANWVSGRG